MYIQALIFHPVRLGTVIYGCVCIFPFPWYVVMYVKGENGLGNLCKQVVEEEREGGSIMEGNEEIRRREL